MTARQRDMQSLLADTSDAPPTLKRLAKVIGWRATMMLSLNLGGMKLYIPSTAESVMNHALAWSVGKDAAKKLVASDFAGSTLFVTNYAGRRLKCLELVRAYEDGVPAHVLAQQHCITASRVYALVQEEKRRLAEPETEPNE